MTSSSVSEKRIIKSASICWQFGVINIMVHFLFGYVMKRSLILRDSYLRKAKGHENQSNCKLQNLLLITSEKK